MFGLNVAAAFFAVSLGANAEDERASTMAALHQCVDANIDSLDDKISPAMEIAKAIASVCGAQITRAAEAEVDSHHLEPETASAAGAKTAERISNGELFLGDVLRHRTGKSRVTVGQPPINEGLDTELKLVALCDDVAMKLVCLSYLRGWIDAYSSDFRNHCDDMKLTPEELRDSLLKLAKQDAVKKQDVPSGYPLSALMLLYGSLCEQPKKRSGSR
jgi:hypothetical protein